MKTLVSLLFAVLLAAGSMACGSSECDKVEDVCEECDGLAKTLCETAADVLEQQGNDDACKAWNEAGSTGACAQNGG